MAADVTTINLNVVERMREIGPSMELKEDEQKQIINCIHNYANPDYKDAICWLAYRIWNAIKAIFGQSDWQLSKDIIKGRVSGFFNEMINAKIREGNTEEIPPAILGKIMMVVQDELDETSNRGASLLLEFLLKAHNLEESGGSNEEKVALKAEGERTVGELTEDLKQSIAQKVVSSIGSLLGAYI